MDLNGQLQSIDGEKVEIIFVLFELLQCLIVSDNAEL